MSMFVWLAAVIVLAAVLTFGLRREHARLEREAAMRRMMASPAMRKIAADFDRLKVEIGTAMLPALRQMGEALAAMGSTIQEAGKHFEEKR